MTSTGTYQQPVIWVPAGHAPPPPAAAATTTTLSTPGTLAAQAAAQLPLPSPTPLLSPSDVAYVNFPEWLWIDPAAWHPVSLTATASNATGSVSATATAIPVDVVWNMGDATPPVTCDGPGVAYNTDLPAAAQHTTCEHTYLRSSAGEPAPPGHPNDAAYPVTVTIQWHVTWSGPSSTGGTLATVSTTSTFRLRVEQIEAVRVAAARTRAAGTPHHHTAPANATRHRMASLGTRHTEPATPLTP